MRNFSSNVEKIFQEWAQRTGEIFFDTRREISYLQATMKLSFCYTKSPQYNKRCDILFISKPLAWTLLHSVFICITSSHNGAEIVRADWSKNDITRVDENDITGGIAFLSICDHSVYHYIIYNKLTYWYLFRNSTKEAKIENRLLCNDVLWFSVPQDWSFY